MMIEVVAQRIVTTSFNRTNRPASTCGLCTNCVQTVDEQETSVDMGHSRWITLWIRKYLLTCGNGSCKMTLVPESARQPEPEERCRSARQPAMAVTKSGGPTGFTRRKRSRRGMIHSSKVHFRVGRRGRWSSRKTARSSWCETVASDANRATGAAEQARECSRTGQPARRYARR